MKNCPAVKTVQQWPWLLPKIMGILLAQVLMQRLDPQALLLWKVKHLPRERGAAHQDSDVSSNCTVQSICSLMNKDYRQIMNLAVRFNKCCSSASEDHSHHLNKQIINLKTEFPASGETNTILDKEHLYFKEIQWTVIATGFQNELKFNFVVINDHIKWLKW